MSTNADSDNQGTTSRPPKRCRPLPPWPTDAAPGKLEKIAVLEWRQQKGFQLWHPEDARMDRERIARVPILAPGKTHRVGWQVDSEAGGRAHLDIYGGVDRKAASGADRAAA